VEVPKFVSEMVKAIQSKDYEGVNSLNSILGILKKRQFQIEESVNSRKVLEFIHFVELWEESIITCS
jgi:hypothetical protein